MLYLTPKVTYNLISEIIFNIASSNILLAFNEFKYLLDEYYILGVPELNVNP